MKIVKVDNEKCIKCMKCYDMCPEDVLAVNEEGYPYLKYDGECWMCGICWMNCPKRCIEIKLPASLW